MATQYEKLPHIKDTPARCPPKQKASITWCNTYGSRVTSCLPLLYMMGNIIREKNSQIILCCNLKLKFKKKINWALLWWIRLVFELGRLDKVVFPL